jgi:anti-anti-sigma factor
MSRLIDDLTETLDAGMLAPELPDLRQRASRPGPSFEVRARQAGRMALAEVTGPLDREHSPVLLERIRPLCDTARRVVLDLRRTEFIDSDAVRALLELRDGMEARGGELRLVVRPGSRVRRTLFLLGLDQRLDLHDSIVDAWIRQRRGD